MNITTKAQYLIRSLYRAAQEVELGADVMCDADISTSMWAEIKGIQNNLHAVIRVLEASENAK